MRGLRLTVLCVTSFVLAMWSQHAPVWAQEPEAHYFVGDEKVLLQPSVRYRALKIKPGMTTSQVAAFGKTVEAEGAAEVETSPLLEKHGIVLIRMKPGVGPSSFAASVTSMSERAEVEAEAPVYSVRGVDQVLINEFIVQFGEDVPKAKAEKALETKGGKVVSANPKIKNRYLVTFPGKTPEQALAASNALAQSDPVVFSEPNFAVIVPARPRPREGGVGPARPPAGSPPLSLPGSAAIPGDPLFPQQWYLHNSGSSGKKDADVDAPKAWDIEKGTASVVVAILDEGVDTGHPDLQGKIVTPYDAMDGDNDQEPNSWDGHGTACAGIAAAMTNNSNGVAGLGWQVKIMPVRIAASSSPGAGWVTTYANIEDGIRTAVDRGAHVLSNSWGGGFSNLVNGAIDHAISNKRVVVIAAGNDSGPVSWPANLSTSKVLVAVSATNKWDEFKTTTSQDGENWWGSNFGPEVNVSAPGVQMPTTDIRGSGGYTSGDYVADFNGTSSATPLVAGAAALLVAQDSTRTPSQVRSLLQNNADDLGSSGFDNRFGHGRLNACQALGGSDCESEEEIENCSALAATSTPTNRQLLVNVALLLSSVLLLLFVTVGRRAFGLQR